MLGRLAFAVLAGLTILANPVAATSDATDPGRSELGPIADVLATALGNVPGPVVMACSPPDNLCPAPCCPGARCCIVLPTPMGVTPQPTDACYYDNVIRSDYNYSSTFAVLSAQAHSGMGWASRCFKFRITTRRRMYLTLVDQTSQNGQFQELWYDGYRVARMAQPPTWGCCSYIHCPGPPPPVQHNTLTYVLDMTPNEIHTIQVRFVGFDGIGDPDIASNCMANGNGGKLTWTWGPPTCTAPEPQAAMAPESEPSASRAAAISESAPHAAPAGSAMTQTLAIWGQSLPGQGTLRFGLEAPTSVDAKIYDAAGRLVRDLDLGPLPAGDQNARWDLADNGGRRVAPGVYFVRLRSASSMFTGSKTPAPPAPGDDPWSPPPIELVDPTPIMDLVQQIAPYIIYPGGASPQSRATIDGTEPPVVYTEFVYTPQSVDAAAARAAGVSEEAIEAGERLVAMNNSYSTGTDFPMIPQETQEFIAERLLPWVAQQLFPCGSFGNPLPTPPYYCSNVWNISRELIVARLISLGYHRTRFPGQFTNNDDYTKEVSYPDCPFGSFRIQALIRQIGNCWTYLTQGPEPNPEIFNHAWPTGPGTLFYWGPYNAWWHRVYTDSIDVQHAPTCTPP